jgi:arylsulfatase A-like enzyme
VKKFPVFFLVFFVVLSIHAQQNKNPNIIIIMTDDMGYADVGFNGCKDIPTPNIDRIAAAGVVFTSGHVSYAVCSPSRAGLLTGRYSQRFGYERNVLYMPKDAAMGLSLDEETMADALGRSGYRSMLVGKWHLGAHPSFHPLKRGFNEFFGFLGGGHQYFPSALQIVDPLSVDDEGSSYKTKLNRGLAVVEEQEYITDAFSREAVSFVDRNRNNPFFLYLTYNAPHTPLQAPDQYLYRFNHISDSKRRIYAAMVSAIDDGVGKLLDKLKETGQDKNTLLFFLSDNGGPLDNGSSNHPLSGKKGNLYEGGIRVPFAMQWPGVIAAGTVYEKPIISLDIFATALGSLQKTAVTKNPLDGVNLIPFLTGKKKGAPHEILFWRNQDMNAYAAINADGKKLWMKGDTTFLFDLGKSGEEKQNLANENPALVLTMKRQVAEWEKGLKPPAFLGLSQRDEYIRLRSKANLPK